ncbi:MAG: hypothetical protein Q7R84_03570 [bacterium]|nr:hypothetical protein [bacterium]
MTTGGATGAGVATLGVDGEGVDGETPGVNCLGAGVDLTGEDDGRTNFKSDLSEKLMYRIKPSINNTKRII